MIRRLESDDLYDVSRGQVIGQFGDDRLPHSQSRCVALLARFDFLSVTVGGSVCFLFSTGHQWKSVGRIAPIFIYTRVVSAALGFAPFGIGADLYVAAFMGVLLYGRQRGVSFA